MKTGFLESFTSAVLKIGAHDTRGFAGDIYAALLHGNVEKAMLALQACFKSIPYLDHGNRILDNFANYEAYYEVITYIVFSPLFT